MTGVVDPGEGAFEDPAEGIFAMTRYSAGQPPAREFKPWHRPRKHFVRREQWTAQARRLFEKRNDDGPLRYLGLPGVDLLDLRYLHQELCVPLHRELRFLGFNSEARPRSNALVDLNTSLDEVRRLGVIDPQSDVIGDDFRSLAREDSIAWQRARKLGPFDVINLDLCDGLATDDPVLQDSIYNAIARLLALQVRSPHPWIMLVTTRIGKSHFHEDAAGILLDRFNVNLDTCADFADACERLLGTRDRGDLNPAVCDAVVFLRMMMVAMCKWLMALGQVSGPNRVELTSSHAYRVNPGAECEDLVSFALRFDPVIKPSAGPLHAGTKTSIDECLEGTRIARRASALKDVDGLLENDAALVENLVVEIENLLRAARYDIGGYREWLAASGHSSGDGATRP